MTVKGVVACGNPTTADTAAEVLREGGNAFDAVLAAMCAACVAEPVLCSLGGGGFLLARPADGESRLYDFFTHTPGEPRPADEIEFYAKHADFGPARQEFHIGMGSIAVPGLVKGLFAAHDELGWMPMRRIVEPAVALARDGVAIEPLQARIFEFVSAIYLATEASRTLFGSALEDGALLQAGERYRAPDFADALEALAREGADLFYRGEIAARMLGDCRDNGGHLTRTDLEAYQVERRAPLIWRYRGAEIATNPPPSSGGVLIAFALGLIERADFAAAGMGSAQALGWLASAMRQTNRARVERRIHELAEDEVADDLLAPELIAAYRDGVVGAPPATRGTTHINVIDGAGNAVALSVSNGEGSAYIVPGTGIMLNNMLGEEDVNPTGFHNWPPARRMSSMMAPSMLQDASGRVTALGSGGSNRIRTAILQVLVGLINFEMDLDAAIRAPRLHVEDELLNVEAGFTPEALAALTRDFPEQKPWPAGNMFFGGVHAASVDQSLKTFVGAGDPRRGGVAITL